jgi:hypothetical protein
MSMLEAIPAFRRIDTDIPHVAAFDVVGAVSGADVENLYGLLEAAYVLHPRINVLMRVVDADAAAWPDADRDTVKEGERHAAERIGRCAIVAASPGLASSPGFFLQGRSVDIHEFRPDEEDKAWEWVSNRP